MIHIVFTMFVILLLGGMTGCGNTGGISDKELEVISQEEVTEEPLGEEVGVSPKNEDKEDSFEEEVTEEIHVILLLSAIPNTDRVLLRWNAIEDATGYQIEWGEVKGVFENSITIDADKTHFLHLGLMPETTYHYRIYTEGNSSDASNIVTVITGSSTQVQQSDVAY